MKKQAIKMDITPKTFTKQCEYEFTNTDGVKFKLLFLEYSRIDGYPIFEIDMSKIPNNTILADIKYQGVNPKSLYIITPMEDYLYDHHKVQFQQNKDILVDFLFDIYDIDLEKLTTKEGMKEIMRDVKLMNILESSMK